MRSRAFGRRRRRRNDYAPLTGDSFGYAQARELHAAIGRLPRLVPVAAVALGAAAYGLRGVWRSKPELRPFVAPAAAFALVLALVPFVLEMDAGGAPVFG